jgi:polyhydroxybutyrate depolymerase
MEFNKKYYIVCIHLKNMKNVGISLLCIGLLFLSGLSGCLTQRRDDQNTFVRTLIHDGIERTYRIHIPPGFEEGYEGSLLFVLHGGGGTAESMEEYITRKQFNKLSDQEGFIVVYPQGYEKHWNDGRKNASWQNNSRIIDDVDFLSTLIDLCVDEFELDGEKVFLCGISNGAQMSYRMACEQSERIAGIAGVVSSISEDLNEICCPMRPLSIFLTLGTDDPLVPYDGGEIILFNKTYGWVISANETVDFWVTHNGCNTTPVVSYLADIDPRDGVIVRSQEYKQGDEGTRVLVYTMIGGGHTWSGGPQYLSKSIIGNTCRDYDQSQVIWEFFKGNPL